MKVIVMAQTITYLFEKGKPIYKENIAYQGEDYVVLK